MTVLLEADCFDTLNSDKTTSLETIGIKESELDRWYSYTKDLGRDSSEFLRRQHSDLPRWLHHLSDLAKKYLNVKTPDEIWAKVKDWDTLLASARPVREASNGKTKMTASLGDCHGGYLQAVTSLGS